jgi:hypothetical protein
MNRTILLENLNEADHLQDLGVDGRITFTWMLKKRDVRVWIGLIWLAKRTCGSCEHDNESSGSIKDGKFPAQLRDI